MTGASRDKYLFNKGKEQDALDKLSLSIIPLSSTALRNARLIKNTRMETTVELMNDPVAGSLQMRPDDIADNLTSSTRDQAIIRALAALNSYDVYSLRNNLKKIGVDVPDEKDLDLSDEMKITLHHYMLAFTRPLVDRIFGFEVAEENEDINLLLNDPNVARVRENLRIMSEKTGISLDEIPRFLASYSDVFLSVAYYRHSFETMSEEIDRFVQWTNELQQQRDIKSSPRMMHSCRYTEETVYKLSLSVRERMSRFNKAFHMFWGNINRESFDHLRAQVEDNHDAMGAVLCGLLVKIRNWSYEFPDNSVGSPSKRMTFIMTEMEPGLDKLKFFENEARKALNLAPIP
ncbi:MAG: hypothetical protein RBS08_01000 [Bdellovibrionales bacterium]|jgi:hypothetical protein|nr:hypothetical protein [Bdellovibrionales bacterium]